MLSDITGRDKVERLAVILTASGVEKLLGVPKIEAGTGINISESIFDLAVEWKIDDKVEIICFDTTSSNTGPYSGSAVLLEQKLNRQLLYLPCRHHIYELVLRCIFDLYMPASTAPDVPLFNRVRNDWRYIDAKSFKSGIDDEIVANAIPPEERTEIMNFCLKNLGKQQYRADYKEFLELTVIFLGGTIPDYSLRTPGPTSHARWMAKGIYMLKMFLLREQLELNEVMLSNIRSICILIVRVYVKLWFGCTKGAEAPNQDLNFLKDAILHPDSEVSNALVTKFFKHLWYLSEEAVGFAFFDINVSLEEKRKMVEALKLSEEYIPIETSHRIDVPKKEILQTYASKELSDFVTPNTRTFFDRMKISKDFLEHDPSVWNERDDYSAGVRACYSICVVNDAAERGVKLITDYNKILTNDEEEKQFLLQIVKKYRENFPNHHKSTLMNNQQT